MIAETGRLRRRIARRFFWPWLVGYAHGKLRFDPAYREVHTLIRGTPALPVLDIGCGMGLLAFYLRERGYPASISGFDVDEKKIRRGAAVAARHYPGVQLVTGDCASLPEFTGHVTMLDVLHYLDRAGQQRALAAMAARVAPGGWCIVRTTPAHDGWRFKCTLAIERLARGLTWMTRIPAQFPDIAAIASQFPEGEFEHDIRPLWGRTPFNSWLLAFHRRTQPETP